MTVRSETDPGRQTDPRLVLIADDYELIRDGFKRLLGYEEDLEVVGEASDGREAVELCRRLRPDLVLMDVRMPEMDGLEATRRIKAEQPEISVLVITTYENPDYLLEAIKVGAAGYVLKDAPNKTLVNAMRRALEGESPVNQELATQLIKRLAEKGEPSPGRPLAAQGKRPADVTPRLEDLTPRELEVLRLVTRGLTNRQIAKELYISVSTVKKSIQRIISKLNVSDRTQAAVRAIEMGLHSGPEGE